MRLLIAVKSCEIDYMKCAHHLIRNTWGKDVGADLKFFMGYGKGNILGLNTDEKFVMVGDSYKDLPKKTREIVRYALNHNYDYIFLCDTGSFVTHHVTSYDFDRFDYLGYWGLKKDRFFFEAGNVRRGCPTMAVEKCFPWASGGGYYLSRKAMEIVANNEPFFWAEDCWVGNVLGRNGILLEDRAHDGYIPYIVRWIHNENNDLPDAMDRRRIWMTKQYEEAKMKCAEGCDGPLWERHPQMRIPGAK